MITLVGGILIAISSLIGVAFFSTAPPAVLRGNMTTLDQLCSSEGINLTQNFTSSMSACISGVNLVYSTGLICGVIVILAGIKMNSYSLKTINKMGGIALAFSLASIFSSGGFLIGLIMGFTGGLIALLYKG